VRYPVIVTNNCGASEWIGTVAGYIIEYDKEELYGASATLLQNERLSKKFGNNGRKLVKNEFGLDNGILRCEKLYETVACENGTEKTVGGIFFQQ